MIANVHRQNAPCVGSPGRAIAVTDQVTGCFVRGESFGYLIGDPFSGRIGRHPNSDQSFARVTKNYQRIEQLERDRTHHEEIDRSDSSGVIAQESLPTLRAGLSGPYHVSAHGRLGDFDPEHKQLAVDARRAAQRIFSAHTPNQSAGLMVDARTPNAPSRSPTPISSAAAPMPADKNFQLNDDNRIHNRREQAKEPNEKQPINVP
ncbi:MAG: hypothetical protein ABSD31_12755 [Candidatus Binataceae bacterium]